MDPTRSIWNNAFPSYADRGAPAEEMILREKRLITALEEATDNRF